MKAPYKVKQSFSAGSVVKNLPAIQEMWVWSSSWKDFLEEGMATHSSVLVCRTPLDRGVGYSPCGSQRVGHNWAIKHTQKLWSRWVVSTLEVDRHSKKLKTPVWGRGWAWSIFCGSPKVAGRPALFEHFSINHNGIIKRAQPWIQSCSSHSSAELLQASDLTCLCYCPHLKDEGNNVFALGHWGEHPMLGAHRPAGQGVPTKWK